MVEMSPEHLKNIRAMCPECTKYTAYHEEHTELVDKWLEENLTDEKGGVS